VETVRSGREAAIRRDAHQCLACAGWEPDAEMGGKRSFAALRANGYVADGADGRQM